MRRHYIKKVLETYGLSRVLRDNGITIYEALEILEDLYFLDLDMYDDDNYDDS